MKRVRSSKKIIDTVAGNHEMDPAAIKKALEHVLKQGYANANQTQKEEWKKLFGSNTPPDADEFIKKIRKNLK